MNLIEMRNETLLPRLNEYAKNGNPIDEYVAAELANVSQDEFTEFVEFVTNKALGRIVVALAGASRDETAVVREIEIALKSLVTDGFMTGHEVAK